MNEERKQKEFDINLESKSTDFGETEMKENRSTSVLIRRIDWREVLEKT